MDYLIFVIPGSLSLPSTNNEIENVQPLGTTVYGYYVILLQTPKSKENCFMRTWEHRHTVNKPVAVSNTEQVT